MPEIPQQYLITSEWTSDEISVPNYILPLGTTGSEAQEYTDSLNRDRPKHCKGYTCIAVPVVDPRKTEILGRYDFNKNHLKRVEELLDALANAANGWMSSSRINPELDKFRLFLMDRIKEEGWKITTPRNKYKITKGE